MNNKIRIGIVGCGRAAELIYLPLLLKHKEMIITAAIDPIKDRREWIQSRVRNCVVAETINDTVINAIDAAIICSTPETHIPLANSFLKCNKHVLIEKPLGVSLEGVDNLLKTLSKTSANLLMAFNHRYWAPVNKMKTILSHSNGFNSIDSCEIYFSGNYNIWNPISFRSDSLEDLGPHIFDLIVHLFEQDIHSIMAVSKQRNAFSLNIKTAGDINIKSYVAHSDKTQKIIKIRIGYKNYFITLGSARFLPEEGIKRKLLDLKDKILMKALLQTAPIKRSYQLQLDKYLQLIKYSKPLKPDVLDGIASLKAVLAARKSLEENKEVFINEIQ